MNARLLSAPLIGLLLAAAPAYAEAPRVVASIAPIHSLVAAVMQGAGEPELLIPAEVSEHDYALKPSDLRKIAEADLVVWIGESLEAYLVKPLETEGVANLELIDAEGINPHAYGDAGGHEHEEHHTAAEEDHDNEHGHHHFGLDPHVWLDPLRAVAIVNAVAERLTEINPDGADVYAANARLKVAGLEALNSELSTQLAPLRDKPFVTFHDGYSYFVERYELNQVGQLIVHPEEQRSGAATLGALRSTIADEGVACAFAEPQYDPSAIQSLAGDAEMRVGVLDPLGAGLEPGPTLYDALMRKNADAVAACLAPTS
jgi:zinc transport system substrate-binding protein